jgi:integrase
VQARRLLAAVRKQSPSGPRLVAFYAVMYYAGLRPEEAVSLGTGNITLPDLVRDSDTGEWEEPADDWGELRFCSAAPEAGAEWTDDGAIREHRQLKSRAVGEWRRVPIAPPLTRILRAHLNEFVTGTRVFSGVEGGELPSITYRRVWDNARKVALPPAEYASPLAKRAYDLRHACVSTWLNGGIAPAQVAEWAGHSVAVLLKIYAKCIDGQDDIAKRRIEDALGDPDELALEDAPPDAPADSA